MKLVIADFDFPDIEIEKEICAQRGVELVQFQAPKASEIISNGQDADGMLTSYGQFTAEVFQALPNLKVVSREGTGYDNVDVAAATAAGTAVTFVPAYASEVVSDHVMALTLCLIRKIKESDALLRSGAWSYHAVRPLGQVPGRRFGIIGMGDIGQATARKAKGLGFETLVTSNFLEGKDEFQGHRVGTVDEILETCDVVSVSTSLKPGNEHLIDAEALRKMKPTAILINTSRGKLVDTVALAKALEDGVIAGAGIDVFEVEPVPADHPLLSAPNAILTPHSAYWSEESGRELRTRACNNAIDVMEGKPIKDIVNPEVLDHEKQSSPLVK